MKYSKFIALVTFICMVTISVRGNVPALRHVFNIHAKCGDARNLGNVNGGKRVMIPITGGYTDGEVEASILDGGADYQLIDTISGRTELNAIYTIQTTDSILINVENKGIIADKSGDYFMTVPSFEAPKDSRYSWMNDRIFICRPSGFGNGMVHLEIWVVE